MSTITKGAWFKDFFCAIDHPLNLAIFRIIFFYMLLRYFRVENILNYSRIPKDIILPPTGVEWAIPFYPLNDWFVILACTLLAIVCFLVMIGLWTRFATIMVFILGIYVMGIPQLYGKVTHYHHLIWFSLIFATSRCGDFLSVDAVLASWKRADQGVLQTPQPHRAYALPLRFMWLLIGMIYFFPGLWKVWKLGLYWALSDNIIFHLYTTWFQFNEWTPAFRIDHYPLLYHSAALATILFEISFIIFIFFPIFRFVAIFGGIIFHNLTYFFMRVHFIPLQVCYISFFNWHAIFNKIGRILFREDMVVLFDGNCQLCRRAIASLKVLDVFNRVIYINALDKNQVKDHDCSYLDEQELMKDMHAVSGNNVYKGFDAYRALSARIPIFWIVLPFLYIWPITKLGHWIYKKVAESRTCRVPLTNDKRVISRYTQVTYSLKGVYMAGVILLVVNSGFGFAGHTKGWPFACYPTFAYIGMRHYKVLEIEAISKNGDMILLDANILNKKYKTVFVRGMERRILFEKDKTKREAQFLAFWSLFVGIDEELKNTQSIRIYETKHSVNPSEKSLNPIQRKIIYEFNFSPTP